MRLYYDPWLSKLVTDTGEIVEGVRTIRVNAGKFGDPAGSVIVTFEPLSIASPPNKADVDSAVAALQELEQRLIVDNGQELACPYGHPDCDGTPMMCLVRETEALGLYEP